MSEHRYSSSASSTAYFRHRSQSPYSIACGIDPLICSTKGMSRPEV